MDGRALTRGAIDIPVAGPRGAAQAAPQPRTGPARPQAHAAPGIGEVAPHHIMSPVFTPAARFDRCLPTDAQLGLSGTNGPTSTGRNGPGSRRDRRCRSEGIRTTGQCAALKNPLKPGLRDRAGISSYEQPDGHDGHDGHDEGDLASWVRARLAVASISTAAFAREKGRPSRMPRDARKGRRASVSAPGARDACFDEDKERAGRA
jgi:hypothetical protein